MRVLFTGSRDVISPCTLMDAIDSLGDNVEIIVGDCPTGADSIVRQYCEETNRNFTVFKADWGKYGRAAGPIRNKEMIDTEPDLVIALPVGKSAGTRGCMKLAQDANISVLVIPPYK